MDGYDGVLEALVGQRPLDQAAQAGVGLDGLTLPTQHPEPGDAARGPQLVGIEVDPRVAQTADAGRRRIGGHAGGVEGPDGAPDQNLGHDPGLGQGLQHADLNGAEVAAASEHERSARSGLP